MGHAAPSGTPFDREYIRPGTQERRIPRQPLRPKARPMTIAAGFVCSDGLLLASDTLYSGPENRFGQKFWEVLSSPEVVVVFGGSGTEAGLKRTRDELKERLAGKTDKRSILETSEDTLRYVDEKLNPAPEWKTYALVGIRIGQNTWLYENQEGKNILNVVDFSSECVGAGFSLGLYFARSLFSESMPIAWAKVVAAHLIKNVKQYTGGCGGDTHLIEIPQYGSAVFTKDQGEILKLEAYLGEVEKTFRLVLPSQDTPDDYALTFRLRELRKTVKRLRNNVLVEGSGSPSLTLGEWLENTTAS